MKLNDEGTHLLLEDGDEIMAETELFLCGAWNQVARRNVGLRWRSEWALCRIPIAAWRGERDGKTWRIVRDGVIQPGDRVALPRKRRCPAIALNGSGIAGGSIGIAATIYAWIFRPVEAAKSDRISCWICDCDTAGSMVWLNGRLACVSHYADLECGDIVKTWRDDRVEIISKEMRFGTKPKHDGPADGWRWCQRGDLICKADRWVRIGRLTEETCAGCGTPHEVAWPDAAGSGWARPLMTHPGNTVSVDDMRVDAGSKPPVPCRICGVADDLYTPGDSHTGCWDSLTRIERVMLGLEEDPYRNQAHLCVYHEMRDGAVYELCDRFGGPRSKLKGATTLPGYQRWVEPVQLQHPDADDL